MSGKIADGPELIPASPIIIYGGWPGLAKVFICGHEDRGEDITAALLGEV